MNTKILVTCLMVAVAFDAERLAQGQSSQVDYQAGVGQRTVHDSVGPIADGNEVWIGTFDVGFDEADVAANADNPFELQNHWNRYGFTTITTWGPPFNQAGSFNGSSTSTDPVFNNQKIYLWIFSTGDATPPAQDFSNVNAYGLFSSTSSKWSFPLPTAPFPGNITDIYSDDVNQSYFGSYDPTRLLLSSFNPVPEPSTLGLLGVGIPVVVLALRKRRSSR